MGELDAKRYNFRTRGSSPTARMLMAVEGQSKYIHVHATVRHFDIEG